MASIYTRGGDGGETHLGDGSRTPKSDARVELYGEVDELNSLLGCCVAVLKRAGAEGAGSVPRDLQEIQSRLFDLGTVLADPGRSADWASRPVADQEMGATDLEHMIDALDRNLVPLKTFILPGGREGASFLHLARTVCRRAERRLVRFAADDVVPEGALHFLNRLSDYLFTAARAVNVAMGVADVPWCGPSKED